MTEDGYLRCARKSIVVSRDWTVGPLSEPLIGLFAFLFFLPATRADGGAPVARVAGTGAQATQA